MQRWNGTLTWLKSQSGTFLVLLSIGISWGSLSTEVREMRRRQDEIAAQTIILSKQLLDHVSNPAVHRDPERDRDTIERMRTLLEALRDRK